MIVTLSPSQPPYLNNVYSQFQQLQFQCCSSISLPSLSCTWVLFQFCGRRLIAIMLCILSCIRYAFNYWYIPFRQGSNKFIFQDYLIQPLFLVQIGPPKAPTSILPGQIISLQEGISSHTLQRGPSRGLCFKFEHTPSYFWRLGPNHRLSDDVFPRLRTIKRTNHPFSAHSPLCRIHLPVNAAMGVKEKETKHTYFRFFP